MELNRKVILYICHSLDGYIAEQDGGLKWLEKIDSNGTDCGFSDFLNSIDTAVIGRFTYEQMLSWDDPLFQTKQCYVIGTAPTDTSHYVQFVDQDLDSFVRELKKQNGSDIWVVGGGKVVSSFLNRGLIDEMILSVIPVTLGSGISLFRDGIARSDWSLKNIVQYGSVAQMHYIFNKENGDVSL